MYEEGFDVDAVVNRLKTTFAVEQSLPLNIELALAHLMRAEDEAVLADLLRQSPKNESRAA